LREIQLKIIEEEGGISKEEIYRLLTEEK